MIPSKSVALSLTNHRLKLRKSYGFFGSVWQNVEDDYLIFALFNKRSGDE